MDLRSWFLPDRPEPLVGLHVTQTGNGSYLADRWPDPRTILVETSQNYSQALVSNDMAWGAFAEGRLVSVAATFFVGDRYDRLYVTGLPIPEQQKLVRESPTHR